ncbi:hypothetical protein H4R21_001061 [Coemansia helicoidea]|uniref:Uncharacterized protein n=1 Tax=Coemansia helicoidea TaxID=1286919 RepID=A0ACC1LDE9_9FUNG|nr:hypothetical protein H4R21_001061 [Coemansia helicoidea]
MRGSESPDALDDIGASIAAMAAALGEDIPAILGSKKELASVPLPEPSQEPSPVEEGEEEEEEEEELQPAEPPLGLAEAMHMSTDGAQHHTDDEADAVQTPVHPAPPSGSELLLAEQAELQSRLGGSADTTLLSPELDDTPARGGKRKRELAQRRRTTGLEDLGTLPAGAADSADEDCSTDDLLARRERLRRQQERRRRRQTVAELKRRRSTGNTSEQSGPQTSSDRGRTLPKRRRLADYVASALGIGSANPPTRPADEDDSQHAYPPRPAPIESGWEHVEAGPLPSDTNIGNSAVLENPQTAEETLETRLDSGGPSDAGDATPMVQPSQQPVELYARSQSPDDDAGAVLAVATKEAAFVEPEDPESVAAAAQEAPAKQQEEEEEEEPPAAAALSPVRTRGRAAAAEPAAPERAPPKPRRTPSRELSALGLPDIAKDAAVVVGGHLLRKQSAADLPAADEPSTTANAAGPVFSPVRTRSHRKHSAAEKPETPAPATPTKSARTRTPKTTAAAARAKRTGVQQASPPATRSAKRGKRR